MKDTGHQGSGVARGQADATRVWGRRSASDATPTTPARAGRPASSDLKPHADADELTVTSLASVILSASGTSQHDSAPALSHQPCPDLCHRCRRFTECRPQGTNIFLVTHISAVLVVSANIFQVPCSIEAGFRARSAQYIVARKNAEKAETGAIKAT